MLWKFGLGSYVSSKIHWPLVLQSAVLGIKTSRLYNCLIVALDSTWFFFDMQYDENGELRRQTPMDLKSGITSKTKLPQQKWTHLQNLCIKVDQMAYAKSLEIFMRQEQRNFDMCNMNDIYYTFFNILFSK